MNEIMAIMFGRDNGNEFVLKDPSGTKAWSERDVKKGMRKKYFREYHIVSEGNCVYIPADNVKSIYFIRKSDVENLLKECSAEEIPVETDRMFG